MQKSPDSCQYDEREAEQRFMIAVKAALSTPPQPQKAMAPKGVAAQSKKGRKHVKASA